MNPSVLLSFGSFVNDHLESSGGLDWLKSTCLTPSHSLVGIYAVPHGGHQDQDLQADTPLALPHDICCQGPPEGGGREQSRCSSLPEAEGESLAQGDAARFLLLLPIIIGMFCMFKTQDSFPNLTGERLIAGWKGFLPISVETPKQHTSRAQRIPRWY